MDLLELTGDTMIISGEILIAYMVISVHIKLRDEHKVDNVVFNEIHKEQIIGIISIFLLVIGFIIRTWARYF